MFFFFFVFPCDIHPSELNQNLPKSQLYTVDPSEGLLSQTEQSLHKPLLCVCVCGGALSNPTVPPSLIPNYQSPFSMVVQFQEYLIWVFERRLIQELGVVPGGSRLLEEMGFSSILSPMFRAWVRGGRSFEMGVYPLATSIPIIFKFHLSDHSASCFRHILFCLLSIRCICACVCSHALYMSPHTGICSHMCPRPECAPTKSHRHIASLDHTSLHVVITDRAHTHPHRQTERENIQYSIVHFSFPFTKSSGESRQLEKRNRGKSS